MEEDKNVEAQLKSFEAIQAEFTRTENEDAAALEGKEDLLDKLPITREILRLNRKGMKEWVQFCFLRSFTTEELIEIVFDFMSAFDTDGSGEIQKAELLGGFEFLAQDDQLGKAKIKAALRTLNIDADSGLSFLLEGTSRNVIKPQAAAELFHKLSIKRDTKRLVDIRKFLPYLFAFFLEKEYRLLQARKRELERIKGRSPGEDKGSGLLLVLSYFLRGEDWRFQTVTLKQLDSVLRNFRTQEFVKHFTHEDSERIIALFNDRHATHIDNEATFHLADVIDRIVIEIAMSSSFRILSAAGKLTAKAKKTIRVRTELASSMSFLVKKQLVRTFVERLHENYSINISETDLRREIFEFVSPRVPFLDESFVEEIIPVLKNSQELEIVRSEEANYYPVSEELGIEIKKAMLSTIRPGLGRFFASFMERVVTLSEPRERETYKMPVQLLTPPEKVDTFFLIKGNMKLRKLMDEDTRRTVLIQIAKLYIINLRFTSTSFRKVATLGTATAEQDDEEQLDMEELMRKANKAEAERWLYMLKESKVSSKAKPEPPKKLPTLQLVNMLDERIIDKNPRLQKVREEMGRCGDAIEYEKFHQFIRETHGIPSQKEFKPAHFRTREVEEMEYAPSKELLRKIRETEKQPRPQKPLQPEQEERGYCSSCAVC